MGSLACGAACRSDESARGQDSIPNESLGYESMNVEAFRTKLNLGCGHIQPQCWINVDGSNRAWLASRLNWLDRCLVAMKILSPTDFSESIMWANLLKRFPWKSGSVDVIYLGEMLEHFTKEEAEHVLRECRRVLRSGGIIRIRVPDNAAFWRKYLSEYDEMRTRPREQWNLNHTRWTLMYFDNLCVRRPRPWQSMGHFHKWMYDDVSLILALQALGFIDATRMAFHRSRIPDIESVEERDDLIIEATAP